MSSTRNTPASRAAHRRRDGQQGPPSSGLVPTNDRPVAQMVLSRSPAAFHSAVQTFPNTLRTKLRWAWYGNLSTAAGSATVQNFRLTSLYDPDFTGTGNQPRFFDTLCAASGGTAPYAYWRVKKAYYRVMFYNNTTTSSASSLGYTQVYYQNPISPTATIDQYYSGLNLAVAPLSTNGSENSIQFIEGAVDIAAFLGLRNLEDDEDQVGSYTANPASNVYLQVGVRAMDDTTVTGIRVAVQFVYDVDFFSLNNAGES